MNVEEIKSLFFDHKETSLSHRYITNTHIKPLLEKLSKKIAVETIGKSVQGNSIYGLKVGYGNKKILMWSQMHGNESTTTKALFDLLNTLLSENNASTHLLSACTLYIIPILNPDGAKAYTRVNANHIDLNRDAQNLSQPESIILKSVFEAFKPDFCYNLHGQRTIFSVGKSNKPATISFLAPAQDKACSITPNRKVAMEVIGHMNTALQELIPNLVGVYDDTFNLNCVGDTFQSKNIPTILFEAGHYYNDYQREYTRKFIYVSLLKSLDYISTNTINGNGYRAYFKIPENQKYFYDIIIKNARVGGEIKDIGILYQEKLVDNRICFFPKIIKIEEKIMSYGHKELDANGHEVLDHNNEPVKVNNENDFVMINNEKISLLLK